MPNRPITCGAALRLTGFGAGLAGLRGIGEGLAALVVVLVVGGTVEADGSSPAELLAFSTTRRVRTGSGLVPEVLGVADAASDLATDFAGE